MTPPFWQCSECQSTDIYQEAAQLVAMNDDEAEGGDLEFRSFYWCNNCDDECHIEEVSKEPVLTLEMQLPVNEKTMELHHT